MKRRTCVLELAAIIENQTVREQTIERLNSCRTPKEWVLKGIFPLYEEEELTYEQIHNRTFIIATLPHCTSLKTPTVNNLHTAMYKYFNIPRG